MGIHAHERANKLLCQMKHLFKVEEIIKNFWQLNKHPSNNTLEG